MLSRIVNGRSGAQFVGLDATPGGSDAAFDAVLDFTGSAQTDFTADPSDAAPIDPTHSQTQGSSFKISTRGVWAVSMEVAAATAATVALGINVDGAAADFDAATTTFTTTRMIARSLLINAAADTVLTTLTGLIYVTADMAASPTQAIVRFLATNNAGGPAPAATLAPLAGARVVFQRIGDAPQGTPN